MRDIETSLGILATHFSTHYDRPLQAALRRRETQLGRAALVGGIVNEGRSMNHALTHENVEEGLTRFSQVGLAGALRNLQRAQRNVRLNAPDAIQVRDDAPGSVLLLRRPRLADPDARSGDIDRLRDRHGRTDAAW